MKNELTAQGFRQLGIACRKWNEHNIMLAVGYTVDGVHGIALFDPVDLFQFALERPEDANHVFREKRDGVHLYQIEIHSNKCKTFAFRRLLHIAKKTYNVGEWCGWKDCQHKVAQAWHAKLTGETNGHIADILYHGKWYEVKTNEGLLWEAWMND